MKNKKIPVIDLHADTFMHYLAVEQNPMLKHLHYKHKGQDIIPVNNLAVTPERLKQGGVKVQAQSLFIDTPSELAPLKSALHTISLIKQAVYKTDSFFQVKTAEDIHNNLDNDKTGIFITIEGLEVIEGELDLLDVFYDLGVRLVAPTWNRLLPYNAPVTEKGGIFQKGKKLISKMDELGMIIDISHSSEQSSFDFARLSKSPIIASHSNVKALNSHARNLSDDQLKMLQERGGIFGMNIYPGFIRPDSAPKTEDNGFEWCWQIIDYTASKFSIDMLAIGTDFDGIPVTPTGMENPSFYRAFAEFLRKKGMSELDIEKVFYRNALRVMEMVM